jgi:hypothetical protein
MREANQELSNSLGPWRGLRDVIRAVLRVNEICLEKGASSRPIYLLTQDRLWFELRVMDCYLREFAVKVKFVANPEGSDDEPQLTPVV